MAVRWAGGRHPLATGQLVDQLVGVADLARQRLLDLFDPLAADQALNLTVREIEPGGLREEGLEVRARRDLASSPSCE